MSILLLLQAALSVLLIITILLQNRAAGLSATFGGTGGAYVQRRGAEKVIYQATIVCSIAFLVLTVIQWYL